MKTRKACLLTQGFFLEKGEDAGRWVKGENRAQKRHIWGKNFNVYNSPTDFRFCFKKRGMSLTFLFLNT